MGEWADLAQQVHDLLIASRGSEIGRLLNRNFDLRREIYDLSAGNLRMVETARSTGASAKFTGSGGAIVGTYDGEDMFRALCEKLGAQDVEVLKPQILRET